LCQRMKTPRHGRFGLLHPLELPYAPWQSISMDFIIALPESEGHTEIWVIVDRFTKMAHFVPLMVGKKTSKDLARIFVQQIWKLHGLPQDIVSDRDRRLTSDIWRDMCAILGIDQRMSSGYQPETDGQTERVNQTVEAYIRSFCNDEQNNWFELLPMAEYSYNNSITNATGFSPFYANYGYHPRTTWPVDVEPKNPASNLYSHYMAGVHKKCLENLEKTRAAMGKYYNQGKLTPPNYKEGDKVMLKGTNIRSRRPTKKFDFKMYGPFEIVQVVSPMAMKLRLPARWQIHPVFHVKLLEPFRQSADRRPVNLDHVLEEMDGLVTVDDYVPEEIMGSNFSRVRNRVLYLVKWEGFPDEKDWTEEPLDHLIDAEDLVRDFHEKNPGAIRDERLAFDG
jgi:hypothetical protein